MHTKNQKAEIVPAICTQCSAQVEVDSSLDAAVCKHCGTAYVVEKAVAQYAVQETRNTHIGHINTVNIHQNSVRKKPKGFFDKSLDTWAQVLLEREKRKAEAIKQKAELEKQALRYLPLIVIASVLMLIVLLMAMK